MLWTKNTSGFSFLCFGIFVWIFFFVWVVLISKSQMSWNLKLFKNFVFQSILGFRVLDKGCSTCNKTLSLLYIKGLRSCKWLSGLCSICLQVWLLKFKTWDPYDGRRENRPSRSCSLISTCLCAHIQTHIATNEC